MSGSGVDHDHLGTIEFDNPDQFFSSIFNTKGTDTSQKQDRSSGFQYNPKECVYIFTDPTEDIKVKEKFLSEAKYEYSF